ncbi:MAG: VOC family protein [Anaerolineae bacterium]|nr:VOC family protein [Anaerolineae bacterium]
MITGLAHACFTVSDLERALGFYRDGLGLKEAFDFVDDAGRRFGVYLHLGGRNFIELFEGQLDERAEKQSYKHICLEVDDINTTVDALRQAGIEVSEPKLGKDQSWQAWITDPDGNRIELHAYTPKSWQSPHLA